MAPPLSHFVELCCSPVVVALDDIGLCGLLSVHETGGLLGSLSLHAACRPLHAQLVGRFKAPGGHEPSHGQRAVIDKTASGEATTAARWTALPELYLEFAKILIEGRLPLARPPLLL